MTKLSSEAPERLFVAVAGAVLLAFFYNLASQYAAVPSCMRYVLPDSVAYVVTARLGTLWSGSTPHVQSYFEGASAPGDGAVRRFALRVKEQLDERGIEPRAAADLATLGLAINANASVAIVDHDEDLHLVIVLPIVNRLRFVQTFQKLFGEAGGKPTTPTVDRAPAEYTAGSWKLAFGDDGSALITDNVGLLRRILATQQQNLAYFHSSDRQSTGFLKLAATRQGRNDAWVRGAIRATTAAELANAPTSPFALLSDVQFAIGFDPQAARIEVRGKLPDVRSELISRLLAPLSANRAKASELLERSEAGIVLADDALSTFIRYLASGIAEESAASFNAIFPELLHELRHFTTLTHIGIAPRQLSERVPGVIAGLTMSKDEADALVFRLQSSLRLKRDREVVRGAIERYRERTPSERAGSPAVQADALLAAGLLRPDRDALWSRYRRLDARRVASMTPEPALAPNDFVGESYVKRRAEGFELRYVMPPVTDDDLDYRLVEERGKIESEDLKRDRYRLCAVYISGTLWLGTDADLLDRWLELLRSDSATNEFRDLASIRPSADDAKLSALALPRQLLESGQLYPDWNVNRTTRLMLADFSQYRTALMTMTTRRGERELDVAVTFRR